jgi:hypothetical protein
MERRDVTDRDGDLEIDARLKRLRDATQDVAPSADFRVRVAAALQADRVAVRWFDDVLRSARRSVLVAAIAAAMATIWAVRSERVFDDALGSYDTVDVTW